MPDAIENYVPQDLTARMRRRAFFVWGVFGSLALVWAALIVLAPIAEARGSTNFSDWIYKFFGYLCHQTAERSFQTHERQFAVCSRCFGVYFGLALGSAIYPLFRAVERTEPLPRFWLFLATAPMAFDWALGAFEIWANTHWSRFLTGAILGAACAVYIVPALVEVTGNFARRERVKRLSD